MLDTSLIGQPVNPPAYQIDQVFEVGGQRLVVSDEPVEVMAARPEIRRRLEVVAPVALGFDFEVKHFSAGQTKAVPVQVTAVRAGAKGGFRLAAPAGWKVEPASQPFQLAATGEVAKLTFNVSPSSSSAAAVHRSERKSTALSTTPATSRFDTTTYRRFCLQPTAPVCKRWFLTSPFVDSVWATCLGTGDSVAARSRRDGL